MTLKGQFNSVSISLFIHRLSIVAFLLLLSTNVFSDEFIVKSFKQIDNKILTNDQKVYDDNDELCAIIMVRTSLINLGITASTPIVGSYERIDGDIRVHLSEGTRMIKFFKDGFSTLEYVIPQRIEKGTFYVIELEYRRTDATTAGNTMGFVLINSTPQGADVYINDEATGLQTPFQNPYNEGYYSYSLKLAQYLDHTDNFTIKPGETQDVDIKLKPNFGSLNLTYTPVTGVTVLINGEKIESNTPISIDKLSPGNHTLSISKDWYDTHEQTFVINREQTNKLNIELKPNFGSLDLTYTPIAGVTILIDGEKIESSTPISIDKLSPGNHTLSISKDWYDAHEQSFTIAREQTTTLNIDLQPNFGGLNLSFTPDNEVTVSIDGKSSNQNSPYEVKQLSPGTHTLSLSKNQYIDYKQDFIITKGEITNLSIDLQANFGDLIISTIPEVNAKVIIDNKEYAETTPLTLKQFTAGKHTIRLSQSMYQAYEQEFVVEKGVPLTIEVSLLPTFGVIDITSDFNADIYIDKQKMGSGNYNGKLLKGIHIIEIKKDKYNEQSRQVEIVVGEKHTEQFNLLPKLGVLSVMTNPAKADIYLNNELQGQSPKFINNLIIGSYNLKLQKQGHAIIEKQIEIIENQTVTINETLAATEVQVTSNPSGATYRNSANLDNNLYTSGYFTDTRSGQKYRTVKIGRQTWMAENLNYKSNDSWCYDNKEANCNKYGRLYIWDAAEKVCPTGWHLPSDDEWKQLEIFLGIGESETESTGWHGTEEGKKMKSITGWKSNGNGSNTSGFNALPGGYHNGYELFDNLGGNGYWWSSTERSGTIAWSRHLRYGSNQILRYYYNKATGRSVRCLKN